MKPSHVVVGPERANRQLDDCSISPSLGSNFDRLKGILMRFMLGLVIALGATTAIAAIDPRTVPTQLPPAWQTRTREVFKEAIEIPSVHHRGEVPNVAKLLASQFKSADSRRRHSFHAS